MKRLIIIVCMVSLLMPLKAQIFGGTLRNDTIFLSDITGPDSVYTKRLRAPDGLFIWYEFPSFSNSTTATITCGPSVDGEFFQTIYSSGSVLTSWTMDSTHVAYNSVGDTIKAQGIWFENQVAQYWKTKISKGNATNDTVIIKYNK